MVVLAALAAAGDIAKDAASTGFDLQAILQSYVTQFGAIVVILLCVSVRKFFVPEWTLRKEEERHAAEISGRDERIAHLESQVQRLQDLATGELMPALTRAAEINARFVEEMAHRRYSADRDGRG